MDRNYPNIEDDEQNNLNNLPENVSNQELGPTTYLQLTTENSSLEFDLIQFREKNMMTKYLSVTLNLENPEKPNEPYSMSFNIPDERSFYALKKFFTQLDWNS